MKFEVFVCIKVVTDCMYSPEARKVHNNLTCNKNVHYWETRPWKAYSCKMQDATCKIDETDELTTYLLNEEYLDVQCFSSPPSVSESTQVNTVPLLSLISDN